MRTLLVISAALGAILLYLLSAASADSELFARHYPLLVALNGALVLTLAGAVAFQVWRLAGKLRARVYGARLTLRLVLLFALVAVVPGVLVYAVSAQFIAKSIESWFDVRVDRALESGLALGRSVLDNMLKDLGAKAEGMAQELAAAPAGGEAALLSRLREQAGVEEVALFSQRGTLIAVAGARPQELVPQGPGAAALRSVRLQQRAAGIDAVPGKGLYLKVLVPVNVLSVTEDLRALQLLQPVPAQLAQDAEAVQVIYRDYQELTLSRKGLKRLFALTLTLAFLMGLFAALGLAFVLSDRLSAPLGALAAGTRAVAQGDFSQRHPVQSRDELGVLTESFNAMTGQLAEARAAAELNQAQVAGAKAYLESLLANLSSGVLALEPDGALRSANPVAAQILGAPLERLAGLPPARWAEARPELASFARVLAEALAGGAPEWERQFERAGSGGSQVLHLRSSRLPQVSGEGFVVVIDDITGLIQAQRAAAWGEVARRMAHEVRNPLTPIRLSAERLRLKLAERLSGEDAEVLRRATETIVNQVEAMKGMVDAFSQYARTPATRFTLLDLNQVVREVLDLYGAQNTHIREELATGLPRIRGDQAQLRQVIHNLVQNAEDAIEQTAAGAITVRTAALEGEVELSVSDNGCGFPDEILARAFEPYVTTKPRGTGLGLAIVKRIVDEHRGAIRIERVAAGGSRVCVALPAGEAA